MAGFVDTYRDLVAIAKTDKRVRSAALFIVVVGCLTMATSSLRGQEEKEKEVRVQPKKEVGEFLKNEIANFQRDLDKNKQYRAEMGEVLKRAEGEVQSNQQKIDWTFNSLVDKLDTMANRVDQLADKIGNRRLDDAKTDAKINLQRKKKQTPTKKVDDGEL